MKKNDRDDKKQQSQVASSSKIYGNKIRNDWKKSSMWNKCSRFWIKSSQFLLKSIWWIFYFLKSDKKRSLKKWQLCLVVFDFQMEYVFEIAN